MKITIQKAEEQKPESKYPYMGINKELKQRLFGLLTSSKEFPLTTVVKTITEI